VEQSFETMWRMAKVAGGIDTTVRLIETVIETLPTFKFRNLARVRKCRSGTWRGSRGQYRRPRLVPQGASFDQRDVQFIEDKFLTVQAEMNAMLAQLARASTSSQQL
jgi:hypothetical protein